MVNETYTVELTAFEIGYLTAVLSTDNDKTAKAIYEKLLKMAMTFYDR